MSKNLKSQPKFKPLKGDLQQKLQEEGQDVIAKLSNNKKLKGKTPRGLEKFEIDVEEDEIQETTEDKRFLVKRKGKRVGKYDKMKKYSK